MSYDIQCMTTRKKKKLTKHVKSKNNTDVVNDRNDPILGSSFVSSSPAEVIVVNFWKLYIIMQVIERSCYQKQL